MSLLLTSATLVSCSRAVVDGSNATSSDVIATGRDVDHVEITPTSQTTASGVVWQYQAVAVFTDSTIEDVTKIVKWVSSDPSIGTFDWSGAGTGQLLSQASGQIQVSAHWADPAGNESHASTVMNVTPANLLSINVTPVNATIPGAVAVQFKATGSYDDATTEDLTDAVTWTSSAPTVAAVNYLNVPGQMYTNFPGSTTVTASLNGVSGSTPLTVTAATLVSMAVTPANATLASGLTQQFYATGTYSDGSTQDLTGSVGWTSANSLAATVSNGAGTIGLVTGKAPGMTFIQASLNGVNAQAPLTISQANLVSIAVTPANDTVAKGLPVQYLATGTYSDTSVQDVTMSVTWGSSDNTIATISNAMGSQGMATTLAVGNSTITATLNGTVSQTDLTVTSATLVSVAIVPATVSCTLGLEPVLKAVGTYTDGTTNDVTNLVNWTSNDQTVATISNASGTHGLSLCLGVGNTSLNATLNGVTASTPVTVNSATLQSIAITPANSSIAKGLTQQLTATGTYSDTSTHDLTALVTWSSSSSATAPVSNAVISHGLVTGMAQGTVSIGATMGAVSASTNLTVTAAALTAISVTPALQAVAMGMTQQYSATGTYTDLSTGDLTSTVTWATGSNAIATISNNQGTRGLLTSIAQGTTSVQASIGSVSSQASVTVIAPLLNSISLSAAANSVAAGLTDQLTATGHYSDGSTATINSSVIFSTLNPLVATVSNLGSNGLVTTHALGTTTATATAGLLSASVTITATAATLASIAVTPAASSVAAGLTKQYTATGTYTDGSTTDLTSSVTWSVGNAAVASISNVGGSKGLLTAISTGNTAVSALSGTTTGSTTLTVTSATLVSIAVTPANPNLVEGLATQFTATGTYSDGSTANITTSVTWSVSPALATISNTPGTQGVAIVVALGNVTVTATLGAISGFTTVHGIL